MRIILEVWKGAYASYDREDVISRPAAYAEGYVTGAAVAFGLIGMAEAIRDRVDEDVASLDAVGLRRKVMQQRRYIDLLCLIERQRKQAAE